MSNLLLAHRQRAHLLEHDLFVAQRTDGTWQLWIEGDKPLQHQTVFTDQIEAKRIVHSLAHRHLDGKPFCDCTAALLWEPVRTDAGDSLEERRNAKRFKYFCNIEWQDRGIFKTGRVRNLSTQGAFIRTLNPAPEGSILKLSIHLGLVDVETKVEVVHRRPSYGMGVRFLELGPPDVMAIGNILNQEDS